MPLFAVSLLFSLEVQGRQPPEPLRELAIHVLSAADQDDARARAISIGKARETTYRNSDGETVSNVLLGVRDVQSLIDDHLFDGIEVASWMFRRGEQLVLDDGGIGPRPI